MDKNKTGTALLRDEDLDIVTGGTGTAGAGSGSPVCPMCGKAGGHSGIHEDSPLGMTGYRCGGCGGVFYVDAAGQCFTELEYDELCSLRSASQRRSGI